MPALSSPPCLFFSRFQSQTLLISTNHNLSFSFYVQPISTLYIVLSATQDLHLNYLHSYLSKMWALYIGALLVISITHWVYRWRNPRCNGKLPPGSMGLPLLGETLQFFTPNPSSDIPPFIKKRMER